MGLFGKLFGKGASAPESVHYKEYRIFPTPEADSGGYRVGARIEKDIDGETKAHNLIRADVFRDHDSAVDASLAKAKQMIDEQGDGVFR